MTPLLAADSLDGIGGFKHVGLLALLLLVPRALQRFRIPGAITSLALGAAAAYFEVFAGDSVVELLGTLGIVSIFLLAGLEVDLHELRRDTRHLVQHLGVQVVVTGLFAIVAVSAFDIAADAATVLALAILTPSAGFILEALPALGLFADERVAVRNKVIATEVLSLGALVVAMQASSAARLGISIGVLVAMILVVPLVLRGLVAMLAPHAPGSEFAFLVLLATGCAVVTKQIGVYYLVGAFVVGITARRFRDRVPSMSSERILHGVEAFTSVFAPFYFFRAGTGLRPGDFTPTALGVGIAFLVIGCGVRVVTMLEHSRWTSAEGPLAALRKAVPMMPTLVFTLVLAEILRTRFEAPEWMIGGLVVYAFFNTLLPSLVVRRLPVSEFGASPLPPWPADGRP